MGKRNWKKWLAVLLCMAMCMGNAGAVRVYAAVTDGETGEETSEQEEEKVPEEEEPETPGDEKKEPSEEVKPETPKDDAEKKPGEKGAFGDEVLPDTEQNTDIIQDGLETDAETDQAEKKLESDAKIAAVAVDYFGTFGDNLTWELMDDDGGTLVISGTGEMPDYGQVEISDSDSSSGFSATYGKDIPWYEIRDEIKAIIIEPGITHIGRCCFADTNAASVMIADSVTSIGEVAFLRCADLVDIAIPNSVVDIGGGAFAKCSSLVNITVPEKVTAIKGATFQDCTSLSSVTLPNTITYIGSGAFSDCQNLKTVKIPNGVTDIRYHTFTGCVSLTSVIIPNSITSIKDYSFYGCSNLKDIYYSGSEEDWRSIKASNYMSGDDDTFRIFYENATIHYNSTGPDGGNEETDTSLQTFNDVYYYDTIAGVGVNIDLTWSWNYLLAWNSQTYNQSLAKMGVALSAAIEGSVADLGEILIGKDYNRKKGLGCDDIKYSPTSPGAVFGHKTIIKADGKTEHVILVVIRGTTSVKDAVNDIKSGMNNGDWGFNDVYTNLRSCLTEWSGTYGEINPGNTKFFITGHSLGGACANILSAQLTEEYGENNVFGYTFATPSPFSEKLSKDNYRNIHNFLCYNDHVPSRFNRQDPWYGNGYYTWFYANQSYQMVTNYMDLTGKLLQDEYAFSVLNLGLHAPSAYMAFLMTNPDLNRAASNVSYIRAKCPIDIEVYNSDNELVGHIVNDEIDYDNYASDVMLTVSNGAKCVYFLNDDTYTIKFTGTDDGTMVYTAASKDMNSDSVEETKVYSDVKIENGKKLKSVVSSYDETDTDKLVEITDVELLVVDDGGDAIARVLSDNEASSEGKSNGTEIPIKEEDDPGNKPGTDPGSKPGDKPSSKPNGGSGNGAGGGGSDSKASASTSFDRDASGKTVVETWQPVTPDEKKRYACMGTEAVRYTLAKDNAYRIVIENAVQGPLCFDSFESALAGYTIGRTYNIYTLPNNVYSREQEVQFTLTIPEAVYKEGRIYKMICVTKNGVPVIYDDLDDNPRTITVRTNKFYVYALIYK